MSGSHLEADPLVIVCYERVYRHIPYLDTCSDALEVDLEIFEEGRRNASAQRWYVHCCLRNSEEYLCYCCKY
jgi:hypothetical protein